MDYLDRSLKGIVIDPGHGGVDSGASGNGLLEKNLTLMISKYMYDRFKELGVPVMLTRDKDEDLPPSKRTSVALSKFGNSKDVILLSNHINAGGGEGAEVIYSLRNKDTLAASILNNLVAKNQIGRKFYQRRLPSNSSKDYYFIMRDTPNTESLIIEYGFIDNKRDADRIQNNYKEYVEAVIKAVMEYKGLKYVPPKEEQKSDVYIVKLGDTLWTIAKNNGITVQKLKEINNLSSNLLKVGQTLKLKDDELSDEYYIVKSGDNLWNIAKKYNTTVQDIKTINNLKTDVLKVGQKLIIPPEETIYIVKVGDTLYSIANKYNITVQKLKEINNLNSNLINVGQKLLIK